MEESNPVGRPTKYKSEFNDQAYKLCLLGATDKEIADFFEVNEDTVHEWKKVYPQFSESVKRGKIIADAEVASSLHKRAVGYKFDEVTYEKVDMKIDGVEEEDDEMKTEAFKKKIVTKEIAPDPGAALNWLKNRQKDKWRDKQEVEHSGQVTTKQIFKIGDIEIEL
jgi:hypothetical protein